MNRLADVELQLVMHGLDARSLLQLARCSRQLLHAADHPFAWLRAASFPALLLPPDRLETASAHPTRLLRHTRVSLCWSATDGHHVRVKSKQTLIDAVSSLALPLEELAYLDSSQDFRVTTADWMRVLTSPAVRQLRILRMIGCPLGLSFDSSMLRAIASLPHLHTLEVDQCAVKADVWAALPDAPQLTSLSIVDRYMSKAEGGFANSCLKYVAQCSKLIHLNIWSFALQGDGFRAFFSPWPCTPRLQSLTLRNLDCRAISAADSAAVLSSLADLNSISIDGLGLLSLLPSLACAPSLRHLAVDSTMEHIDLDDRTSALVLTQLFAAAPSLQCTLHGVPLRRS